MQHKKFFIKDFIRYCSPCFACDNLMDFRFGFSAKGEGARVPNDIWTQTSQAIITDQYTEVELSIRYHTNLKIWIYHRNNKVVCSDSSRFNDYLTKRDLFLVCHCLHCTSTISSQNLDFQTFNGVVGPTTLRYEKFHIIRKNQRFGLESDFNQQTSVGTVRTYTAPSVSGPDLVFQMKLLPKYKLGNRQKLIDKLNTYAVFS